MVIIKEVSSKKLQLSKTQIPKSATTNSRSESLNIPGAPGKFERLLIVLIELPL